MNGKHSESSLLISKEGHTGLTLFIPFCFTQGCHWIGELHFDKVSAVVEGNRHLDEMGVRINANRVRAA